MLPVERHLAGREHTAAVINWWIHRCGFTHVHATALAAWACGDSTWLQGSQLSHLRNAKMRTPQLKLFEGLAGLNDAIAGWRLRGRAECIREWGAIPKGAPDAQLLDQAIFLWHPDHGEGTPLQFHDWCDLFTGRLTLPYADNGSISPGQSRIISERIGEELDRWLAQQGGIRAGLSRLISLYPVDDARRIQRLQHVILGADTYSAADLEEEQFALSELFGQLWVRPVSPSQLYAELAAVRRSPDGGSETAAHR